MRPERRHAACRTADIPVRRAYVTISLTDHGRFREELRFDQQDLDRAAAKLAALQKSGALALYDFAFQPHRWAQNEEFAFDVVRTGASRPAVGARANLDDRAYENEFRALKCCRVSDAAKIFAIARRT